jgi:hypothetical protein
MKGTLFSADFIEDSNGEFRILEINTDTTTPEFNLQYFDYSDLINLLDVNNITKFTIIHKPSLHNRLVNHLSSSLSISASFIDTIDIISENVNVIYPTQVSDSDDTFILRMAYDESSIFDSEYCKGTLNLLKLFVDNNATSSVVEFYYSSSTEGVYNTITPTLNANNIPDLAVKTVEETHQSVLFYKIGSELENELESDRVNSFLNNVSNDDIMIQKYHTNSNTFINNKSNSIRSFGIVYGSNLDIISISNFKINSIFELPTEIEYNPNSYVNLLDKKHYYEYATNFIKTELGFDGILDRHLIIKADDSQIEIGNVNVGDVLKSYQISDWSNDESIDYMDFKIDGDALPSGSMLTESTVIYKNSKKLNNKALINLCVNNNEDSLFVAPGKTFLVYDSVNNIITWKTSISIEPITSYLIDFDGSKAQVTSNELFITSDDDLNLIEIDVEDTDTYIIAGTTPINSFVTHNSPCFVAGTQVILSDGSTKNIEDVKSGDIVLTFDLKSETLKNNIVNSVFSKTVNDIVEYKFSNGQFLKCTFDHPIYVESKGWASFDNELSNKSYSLEKNVNKIEINDNVKLFNGISTIVDIIIHNEETTVYNLQDIEGNHNYFANNILVHNRFCFIAGTKVTMEDGSEKNIEDVELGDIVLSFNEETQIIEPKKVIRLDSPIHDDLVEYTLSNGTTITSTFDHPYYVNGLQLASYQPNSTNERYDLPIEVTKIKVGDFVNLTNKEIVEIISIVELDRVDTQTYIFSVENNRNFYANGILVHNK